MPENFRDKIYPPQIQDVYDFWCANRNDGRLPRYTDLDLMTIPSLVPHCFVMDAVGGRRFRYRFVGTKIDQHLGIPLTGRFIDEVRRGRLLETLTEFFATVEKIARPGYVETQMPTETQSYMVYHRLALPLSENSDTVDKIIGAHFFHTTTDRSSYRPYVEDADADEHGQATMIFDEG